MLTFWKKQGSKEKESKLNNSTTTEKSQARPVIALSIDLPDNQKETTPALKYSRLSKPLVEIMRDSESLGYFIQYLETINISPLVKCLMDIDNLRASMTGVAKEVTWGDVRNLKKIVDGSGGVSLDFFNGISYTNNVACDISGCVNSSPMHRGRVLVCATSQQRLTEMQLIEQEMLTGVLGADTVAETTLDALKIFYKYFSYVAPFKIILPEEMFHRLLAKLKENVSSNTFNEVRDLIFRVLEKEYYLKYLKSDSHCKYQMTILTSSHVLVSDILYNESALFYFMEFLESEGCRGLLEFWMAANIFQEQFADTSYPFNPDHAQEDAMVLYNKYFSLQASHPLNLGDNIRFLVEENICREGGPLPSCFEPVQTLIVKYLQTQLLKPFLQSELYFKYLSELISTVNAGPSRPGGSDCSSEMSLSTKSSPVTSEADCSKKKPNLTIDSRSLNDPDSLWRRNRHNGLTFGRVNSLGRFQTDLEPGPDRKIGLETRITKAMKKLVNMEEEKAKEELAWQVAEMIVKDVTNLTMPTATDSL